MTILTEKPYPIPFFDLAPFTNPGFCFTLAINFELKFDFDMGDVYCSDCKKNTEVVFDHSAGDTVCSECGLVLESHSIDETSEWRTFANESGDNDHVRVGGPTNPLLSDGGLSTVISKPNGTTSDFLSSSLDRWQNRGSNPDRSLILAFKTIATMSDRYWLFIVLS